MTWSEENAMKYIVSSITLLITSGLRTLEAEAAEMRQKNLIRILNVKQRRKEKALGNQKEKMRMFKHQNISQILLFCQISEKSMALTKTLVGFVLDLPEDFWR